MSDIDWTFQLAEQLDWHWRGQLRPRLDGMTDAEYREVALLRDLYLWHDDGAATSL